MATAGRAHACVLLLVTTALGAMPAVAAAQTERDVQVRLVYTGRSLGALGVLRDSDEHELLVEAAATAGLAVRMDTYVSWRAEHVTLYSPRADLAATDLANVLAGRISLSAARSVDALASNNAVLWQDAAERDLLRLIRDNPRASIDFPDLRPVHVLVRSGQTDDGRPLIALAERSDPWPSDPNAWSEGQVNRIEVGGSVVDELAINLGQIGPRATLLQRALRSGDGNRASIVVDLGHRDGDLGVERPDRARIDYTALASLGYQLVVPYELELALGGTQLASLASRHSDIQFLASNVKLRGGGPSLLLPRHVISVSGVRIGLIGLVDPDIKGLLARDALADFTFEPPVDAAMREVAALRKEGVSAVIALSNLHPRDNNFVAREVAGLDAIVADLHVRWSPEDLSTVVELPGRPYLRPGSPALVTRSFANGFGVGILDLSFRESATGPPYLARLSHRLESVTDRTATDVAFVRTIRELAKAAEHPRGELLVPAFQDLVRIRPTLAGFDATTAQGRVSKRMWEEFLARLIRYRARAELAMVRKLPHFPPIVGALHEIDVRAWLWTEDAIVAVDMSGADIKAILAEDRTGDLVLAGVNRRAGTINGRRIQDATFYRVATTDLLLDGARFRAFDRARRVTRQFEVGRDGSLNSSRKGRTIPLKQFVFGELARLRHDGGATRSASAARRNPDADLARLLDVDPPFEPLITFAFDRPTVFASISRAVNNEGYGAVPESRVLASDSEVVGITGRYVLSHDRRRVGFDIGTLAAYSRQSVRNATFNRTIIAEMADDLRVDFTARGKKSADAESLVQPFLRAVFDTEFTPTIQPATGRRNPHQKLARFIGGLSRSSPQWPVLDIGPAIENDLTRNSREFGFELNAQYRRRFVRGQVTYRWDTAVTHFFPSRMDDETDLGTSIRTVHELLIPIVDELSLSIAADVLVFRGKVEQTRQFGASTLLRVGLTYDRLWKPRYQPFF